MITKTQAIAKDSEDQLETELLEIIERQNYETFNAYNEQEANKFLERENSSEVVLKDRFWSSLKKINPSLSDEVINVAIDKIVENRDSLSAAQANQEVYYYIRNGVDVEILNNDTGELEQETVQVIDWNGHLNDYLAVRQLWVVGEMYKRRPDIVIFINGLPLILVELKTDTRNIHDAYKDNITDYKETIPQLFWYNQAIIISNGSQALIGSLTAPYKHYFPWKENKERLEIEEVIFSFLNREKLLDYIENFILFTDLNSSPQKIIAKYHQYDGVNKAFNKFKQQREAGIKGKGIGVFWHTQGSGKSFSMLFFSEKTHRKLNGNFTFLIVTDRDELDKQIYSTTIKSGLIQDTIEDHTHAKSIAGLRDLLKTDNRYIFSLIHKFQESENSQHPVISNRDDIVIITDEAHRSQYDVFALNMRLALPNAAFIGFTGTPLIDGEEQKTREVFGDYISKYGFQEAIDDGNTVPLYYSNHTPHLTLDTEDFDAIKDTVLAENETNDAIEERLEKEFPRSYHLLSDPDRIEAIADDVTRTMLEGDRNSKAIFVAIDRLQAVKQLEATKESWQKKIQQLKQEKDHFEKSDSVKNAEVVGNLKTSIEYMEATEMAVVVSQSQNELEFFRKHNIDFEPYRRQINSGNLAEKFKSESNHLRIVFVCAMWITGFDAPSCSIVFLDKPQANHTLMQTIARANRVRENKTRGLIIDYIGVFKNLEKALAVYAQDNGSLPVKPQDNLITQLQEQEKRLREFFLNQGLDLEDISQASKQIERIKLRDKAIEIILKNEDSRSQYAEDAGGFLETFLASMPNPKLGAFMAFKSLIDKLNNKLETLKGEEAFSEDETYRDIEGKLQEELHNVVSAEIDRHTTEVNITDLDLPRIEKEFEEGKKRAAIEKMRSNHERKIKKMISENPERKYFQEKLEKIIALMNDGGDPDEIFKRLKDLENELQIEEERAASEDLSEEELAMFDLICSDVRLQDEDLLKTKEASKKIIEGVNDLLVLDWRKKSGSQAKIRVFLEESMDKALPSHVDEDVWQQKCDLGFDHIYSSYFDNGSSVYSQ